MSEKRTRPAIALGAVFSVIVLNIVLLLTIPSKPSDAAHLPSLHTWEWWRTQSYLSMATPPDIVLLGSSLVMIPVSVLDADYLNRSFDAVHHSRSEYMEDRFKNYFPKSSISCVNFGLPGGMISDDYMVARALFDKQRKPKVIVLGITLRDFIEGHVLYPASTTSYKYFKRFFDTESLTAVAMPEWWQRLDYYWDKYFIFSGRRLEVQLASCQLMQNFLRPVLSTSIMKSPVDGQELNKNLASKLKSVAEEGDFVMQPHESLPFDDNTREYRTRFRSPNLKLFNQECIFFDKLLELAKENDIGVLVANMPLTQANMELMPKGSYNLYLNYVQNAAQAGKCSFVDLNSSGKFQISDFRDTAHMNSSGGKKFVDAVCASILGSNTLCNALVTRNESLIAGSNRTR